MSQDDDARTAPAPAAAVGEPDLTGESEGRGLVIGGWIVVCVGLALAVGLLIIYLFAWMGAAASGSSVSVYAESTPVPDFRWVQLAGGTLGLGLLLVIAGKLTQLVGLSARRS